MIRYVENHNDVYFPRVNARPHKSAFGKYCGMTFSQARRKMKAIWIPHSVQNEYIHYLKEKGHIKDGP